MSSSREAELRRAAPVFFAPDVDGWIVTRREDVLRALADTDAFSSAGNLALPPPPSSVRHRLPHGYPWTTPTLANGDPPDHTRLRKLVNAAFSRARIRRLAPAVHGFAREIVEGLAPRGHAEAIGDLARPLAERSLALALGYPESELEALRSWLDALDVTIEHAGEADAPELVAAAEQHADFADRLTALLATARGGDDLLALLAAPGLVTPVQAQSCVMQVVMAGVATTAHTIAHSLRLALDSGRWEGLRGQPADIPAAVEEALRHRSTVRGMPRTATREVTLGGAQIAAGDRVWLMFASANRDRAFAADAEEYLPDREDGRGHLAFGRGLHFCPGAPLARLETEAALRALLPLDGLELDRREELTAHPSFAIDALVRLPIRWG